MGLDVKYLDYFVAKAGIDKMILSIEEKHKGKDIPKASKDALETLKTTLEVINYLYKTLDSEYKLNEKVEKQVASLAFTNGMLSREVKKVKRENERLTNNIKL